MKHKSNKLLTLLILALATFSLVACGKEEASTETQAPIKDVNSLLDKYTTGDNASSTEQVADNGEETTTTPNNTGTTNTDNSKNETAEGGKENTTTTQQVANNQQPTTTKQQSANNQQPTTTKQQVADNTTQATTSKQEEVIQPTTTSTQDEVPAKLSPNEVNWKIEGTTLTIWGNGEITSNNGEPREFPWYDSSSIIQHVIIEEGITGLCGVEIEGYHNIISISLPNSLEVFHIRACDITNNVTIPSNVKKLIITKSDIKFNIPENLSHLSVSGGSLTNGNSYTNINFTELPNTLTLLEIQNCYTPNEIIVPNSVTNLGYYCFQNCPSLTHVKLPNTITKLELYQLYNCSSLKSIEIPSSITSITDNALQKCPNLTTIYGEAGSFAETYANVNGYTFIAQ